MSDWISIEVKPEREGSYLVATDKGAVCTSHWYRGIGFAKNHTAAHITHWMPLPEPPREAEI